MPRVGCYNEPVYGVRQLMTHHKAVEGLVQETFLPLYNHSRRLSSRSKLMPWLLRFPYDHA